MIELGSAAFATLTRNASGFWNHVGVFHSPLAKRSDCKHIHGDVAAIIFDFDGTLTSTPGDRADRRTKIRDLKGRSEMLAPWLRSLRGADFTLGILSKSTTDTIVAALKAGGLQDIFDGPVRGKAVGFEGKAGFIKEMCEHGALQHLGLEGMHRVLLVDDDTQELVRAREFGIQTFPAPEDGGLQAQDFDELFGALKITMLSESDEIYCVWARGWIADSLEIPSEPATHQFSRGSALRFSEYYGVDEKAKLGQGSFGWIRPGVHKSSGKDIAVKFVRRSSAGKLYIQTFVEGEMWTFLLKMSIAHSHTNVLKYFDFFTGPTILYTIMEVLDGEDLLVYLKKHSPITEGSCQSMVFQLLSALQHVHRVMERGIIHRDVKLENLRFRTSASDTLVLVDFGLCCFARPEEKRKVVGTLPYMAPEVFTRLYTTQVDLWSSGVLLFIVLTGKLPWQLNPFQNQAPGSGSESVDSALEACRAVNAPSSAVDLLSRLLVIDPGQRLTAAEALDHRWVAVGAGSAIGSGDGPLLNARHDMITAPDSGVKVISSGTGTSPFARGSSCGVDTTATLGMDAQGTSTTEVPGAARGGIVVATVVEDLEISVADGSPRSAGSSWWNCCSSRKTSKNGESCVAI